MIIHVTKEIKTREKINVLYKIYNIPQNKAPIGKRRYRFGERPYMYHYQNWNR